MVKKLLSQKLAEKEYNIRPIFVGTYIPRECGIATFTKDLTNSINILNPKHTSEIIAINDCDGRYEYPWEVKYRIDQNEPKSYINAADYINQSSCDIVCIQHEFGIYGGDDGIYIIPFVDCLKKNFVATLHTVLPNPSSSRKNVINKLGKKCQALVVMINEAAERLVKDYGVSKEKIVVIPHGVPDVAFSPSTPHKKKLGIIDKNVILTFGLLSSGKGIEYVIKAMPKIVKKHKDAIYYIVGQTHPAILKKEGEKYRQSLIDLTKKLNVEQNVKFINRYLSLDELMGYIQASDIYVTPYNNPDQIASGTLAYAVGAGKPCISTPYVYATSVLANGRGLIVPFKNSQAIAEKTIELLDDKEKRIKIAKKAYLFGRNMTWDNVALKYLNLFSMVGKKEHEL